MKLGLISDTHGFLDPTVFEHFKNVDQIWHAGDIGTEEVLESLAEFKPTVAVYGNIDGQKICVRTREHQFCEIAGCRILMIHIAGKPPKYNQTVRSLLTKFHPDLLICGHSHFLKVEKDNRSDVLFLNPGAAGRHGFHKIRTLLRFEIENGMPKNLEVIELGSRSKLS